MVWRFTDPDEYAASIRAVKVEISVTQPRYFEAKLVRIDLHKMWMQRFSETLPRIAHFDLVRGRAIISFPTKSGPRLLCGGIEIQPTDMVRYSEAHSSFNRSNGSVHFGSMSLPVADLDALGASFSSSNFTPPRQPLVFRPAAAAMQRLQKLHAAAGRLAEDTPDVIASPEAARGLEQALLGAMADCLCPTDGQWARSGNHRREKIMKRFFATLEVNPDGVLHMPEICATLGVSNRGLTTYCHDTLGMSPHRYLKLRQMHLARRALIMADPASATVTEIATSCGFWELGRFSTLYRALFGEPPSVTLRRLRDAGYPAVLAGPLSSNVIMCDGWKSVGTRKLDLGLNESG
jgi:AraC-like DNA-binding protein